MKAFIYSELPAEVQQELAQKVPAGVELAYRTALPTEQQQAAFQQADVVLGNPPADWFATGGPPQLRLWQLDSAGFDRYQGIQVAGVVANMGDFFAWPCAETMVAGLLAHYRALPALVRLQDQHHWAGPAMRAHTGLLRHKRVVILGAGAIGLAVRQQLLGFECAVQLLARTDPAASLHSREQLRAALPTTDVVVNCLPGSATHFFGAAEFAAMPVGSLYASVGRGTTTDETALLAALHEGRLAGAVLDVTADEPLPPTHPFWAMPQVLLTQHTGGGQPFEALGKARQFWRNLGHLHAGEPLENVVELGRGY